MAEWHSTVSVMHAPLISTAQILTGGLIQSKLWEHIFQMGCCKRHGHCIALKCARWWRGYTTAPAAYGKSISVFIPSLEDPILYIWPQILPSSSVICPGKIGTSLFLSFPLVDPLAIEYIKAKWRQTMSVNVSICHTKTSPCVLTSDILSNDCLMQNTPCRKNKADCLLQIPIADL